MKQYRKKPVVVEAIQWDGTREMAQQLLLIDGLNGLILPNDQGFTFKINTLEGRMVVSPGDFLIKGVKGEYYPCKPDIFAQTYEAVQTLDEGIVEDLGAPTEAQQEVPTTTLDAVFAQVPINAPFEEKSSEEVSESEK